MSHIIPATGPRLSAARVDALLAERGVTQTFALLAVRAYRRDTMGVPGRNDVGIYDDAIFLRHTGGVTNFNANCDPSKIGWNPGIGKPFALLQPGVWPFILGLHKGQYAALRQPYEEQAMNIGLRAAYPLGDPRTYGHFTVQRDDGRGHRYDDTGYHAINIHRGSEYGTSSWGCQTLPPREWPHFIALCQAQFPKTGQKWVPYCLIDGPVC